MFIFSSILVYFFSIIIAISAMTFVVLLTISDEVSKRRQFFYLLCFCASNFLIETLYLWMTIQDSLLHYYHYNVFMRVLDTSLYTLQSYSWCRYLLYFPSRKSVSGKRTGTACNALAGISLIIGVVTYAFLINNEFLFISDLGVVGDLSVSLLLSIMLIFTAVTRKRSDLHFNKFNLLITFMLILIQWWTSIFMIFETHTAFPFEIHEYLTGAAQQMFVILALAIYVYKTDYSGVTLRSQLRSLIGKAHSDDISKETLSDTHDISAEVTAHVSSASSAAECTDGTASDDKPDIHISPYDDSSAKIGLDDSILAAASDGNAALTETAAVSDQDKLNAAAAPISADGTFEAHTEASAEPHTPVRTNAAASGIPNLNDIIARADRSAFEPQVSPAASDIHDDEQSPAAPAARTYAGSQSQTSGGITAAHTTRHAYNHQYDDGLSDIERIFDEKQLTKREREVARLAYTGLTNPEIADRLCISQHTVKRHMHSIFEKLNISARIELVHLMNRM